MTHTPGPWKVDLTGMDSIVNCPDGRSFIVGDIVYHEENKANARLIAAAPELLEALEAINKWCGTDDAAHYLPFEPPWYQQLRAAIAKAKGEE